MAGGSLFNSVDDDAAAFDDEFDTKPVPADEAADEADAIVDEATEQSEETQDEQLDDEMSEAERRIALAGYYKILAKGGVFKDGSEEAAIVDQELREFARDRMSTLLGLPSTKPKVEQSWPANVVANEEQANALLQIADRFIERQNAPSSPVVKPLAAPAQPAAPVVKKPQGPVVKPLAPPPNATPRKAPAKPAAKPVAKKPAAPKAKKAAEPKLDYDNIPDGEVFEEKGKKYKFVRNPDTGDRIKLHVTGQQQVRSPHALPMPMTRADIEAVSEAHALRSINSNPALKDQRLIAAAALSHVNGE
jgi:hypothetical protein